MIDLIGRFGVFQTAPTGTDDTGGPTIDPAEPEESAERFCMWVPILVTVAVLRWVTKEINKRVKKCKGFWKVFCWIAAIIVIIVTVVVLVFVTIVWWVYICGQEVSGGRESDTIQ